jgi:DNA-binding LytR/AlgR family response regulator
VTNVRTAPAGGLRVILCFKFASRAPFEEVTKLRRSLVDSERVLHAADVSGGFDFMAEIECDDLGVYQSLLDTLAARFGPLIDHYEASFVCRRYVRERASKPNGLWIPTATGMQRIARDRIDKVTAEGDYVRIHSGDHDWLVHTTMTRLTEQLSSSRFLRLNRSLIARCEFIDRLRHDRHSWTVRLIDGSEHRIAKSRSKSVLAALKADSPIPGNLSSKSSAANGLQVPVA